LCASAEGAAAIQVNIPAEHVTSANRQVRRAHNRLHTAALVACCQAPLDWPWAPQVRARQLWGTDVYTEDSDLVAVLVHTGFYALPPGAAPPVGLVELRATLRPASSPTGSFVSTSRHGIRSRAWGAPPPGNGLASFAVEKCVAAMSGGQAVTLDPGAWRASSSAAAQPHGGVSAVPTFQLGASERGGHATRGGGEGGRGRSSRYCAEVTLQYSLSNEPWLKYSLGVIADRGLKRSAWTSARLRQEVLFLETPHKRFQLAWDGLAAQQTAHPPSGEQLAQLDAFTFAACRLPALDVHEVQSLGVPLPAQRLEVLAKAQSWQSIVWGVAGVTVQGTHYPVCRLLFMPAQAAAPKPGIKVPPVVK